MANKLQVDVVTPVSTVLSGQYNMVVFRSVEGELGILANHLPLIANLLEWPVKLKKDDGTVDYVNVCGGFLEMRDNKVTVLATAAELAGNIDQERACAAKERAEARLAAQEEIDRARAEMALKRSIGRIKTLELSGRK
jgi:F-type H+-transporting ATPase subunit epsilon